MESAVWGFIGEAIRNRSPGEETDDQAIRRRELGDSDNDNRLRIAEKMLRWPLESPPQNPGTPKALL
ncbi:hypothetical protein TNIN_266621 [Trichonephila inaurata madagascariensis]|uniref:Uncharacterized protein n=1 Tax=Trichonephila inaurata madagascariensis TaxID=2747483 RepID=A0A8X7BQJ3_9ARAC|nr:hypothetical protein TNIN_266621 [Trichonephila inaurata madagascariensis]